MRSHPSPAPSSRCCHHQSQELRSPAAIASTLFPSLKHAPSWKSLFPVSCAFCPGYLGILHPKGRKFVCGNEKDRMVQGIQPFGNPGIEMPFTCRMGLDSNNGHA
uniref:Uncharacterized protein n=1 Tax=Hordeum vulgare subsp. vulgare TaxID=112509 RepID=A0A8I6XBY2_HORVV